MMYHTSANFGMYNYKEPCIVYSKSMGVTYFHFVINSVTGQTKVSLLGGLPPGDTWQCGDIFLVAAAWGWVLPKSGANRPRMLLPAYNEQKSPHHKEFFCQIG